MKNLTPGFLFRTCFSLTLSLAILTITILTTAISAAPRKTVRFVYLVSKDRTERSDFKQAIEHAARDIQKWYGQQLGGPTFRLHRPVVEVVQSKQKAAWFYSNNNGSRRDDWGYNNALAEARRLLGARHNDPRNIWVIYSDGPGDKGRGGSGVCVMPEDDLLGLTGQHPTQKSKARWIAGLGHELGHAFGLPHPKDTKKHKMAIMWSGIYGGYPDKTYFTPQDKEILLAHPFIFKPNGQPVAGIEKETARYSYDGGVFVRVEGRKGPRWKEIKTDGSGAVFVFKEIKRERGFVLFGDERPVTIKLPLAGGRAFLRVGSGDFRPFVTVKPR